MEERSVSNLPINKDDSLAYLNILKFIAAIIIAIFYHNFFLSQYSEHNIPVISFLHNNAYLLVEMFFIISGMLFYKAYFNRLVNKKITFKKVLRKRIMSTYVIATIMTLYVFMIDYISFKVNNGDMYRDGTTDVLTLFINLICGGGKTLFEGKKHYINSPAWYLTALLFAYLIALLITFIITKLKKRGYILLFLLPIGLGLGMYFSNKELAFLWNIDLARSLMFFFFGIYFMMLLEKVKTLPFKWRQIVRFSALAIAVTYIILLCIRDVRGKLSLTSIHVIGFIFYPSLILGLYDIHWLNKFASLKQVKFMTKFSFEIYLLNYPIHATMFLIGYNNLDFFLNMGYWFILFDIVLHLIIGFITYLLITKKLTGAVNKLLDIILFKIRCILLKRKQTAK